MQSEDVKRFGLILAVQAEIDGIKTENVTNKLNGLPPAFCRDYFIEKQNKLEI